MSEIEELKYKELYEELRKYKQQRKKDKKPPLDELKYLNHNNKEKLKELYIKYVDSSAEKLKIVIDEEKTPRRRIIRRHSERSEGVELERQQTVSHLLIEDV